jgi:hypothetical protein
MGALHDQSASGRKSGNGAGGTDGPECGCGGQTNAVGIGSPQVGCKPALGHKCLYHGAVKYANTKAQPDFQKKTGGCFGRFAE